jgi:hypothetical protein
MLCKLQWLMTTQPKTMQQQLSKNWEGAELVQHFVATSS